MRFTLARLAALIAVACCSAAAEADGPVAKGRPNVLFIAVDDLRPEFGAYGSKVVKSPNLDRLAARGLTFNRAYCQQAVCSPSRTSLLTGKRPDTTRVWDLVTHFRDALPDVVTLPQHFKDHGYFVQGMGKIYHPGYDDPRSWSVPPLNPKAPTYALPENVALQNGKAARAKAQGKPAGKGASSRGPAYESADVPDDTYFDGKLADRAVQALRAAKGKDHPFFLAVGFHKPHLPFIAPKKYWDLYDPATIELAPNPFRPKDAPAYAVQPGGELRSYHAIPPGHIPDPLARTLKHAYYASISYMDAQLGKVLDELDRLGLREDTIVVVWGDHGWKLGEHDAWCKHTNVELDTNAPLIVAAPGRMKSPGSRTNALVEFVDIYPSLAELAGLPAPPNPEGLSFAPVLSRPEASWKRAAYSQYPRTVDRRQLMGYSMRTDRYRLTRWVDRAHPDRVDAVELYDHQTDPGEDRNIALDPANAALLTRLTEQWQAGWKAAGPNRP